jgi:hypothetical protein
MKAILFLAMTNLGTHSPLFPADLPPTLAGFLGSH